MEVSEMKPEVMMIIGLFVVLVIVAVASSGAM